MPKDEWRVILNSKVLYTITCTNPMTQDELLQALAEGDFSEIDIIDQEVKEFSTDGEVEDQDEN